MFRNEDDRSFSNEIKGKEKKRKKKRKNARERETIDQFEVESMLIG